MSPAPERRAARVSKGDARRRHRPRGSSRPRRSDPSASFRSSVVSPPFGEVRGDRYDLASIYEDLNRTYFAGKHHAIVRWSRRRNRRVMGTWRKDLSGGPAVLTINRLLDQSCVPQHYVEFVVYHEMLHDWLPALRRRGRTIRHHRSFHDWERRFACYSEAVAWERSGLPELCRSRFPTGRA